VRRDQWQIATLGQALGVHGNADSLSAIHASTIITSIEIKPNAYRRMAMTQENATLFGKTFDQQVSAASGSIEGRNISPNQMISGSIVLEPLGSGIRVTARDLDHRVLWGFIASTETVTESQTHCAVATYDTLKRLIADALGRPGLISTPTGDPLVIAEEAIQSLEKYANHLRASIAVKLVTEATHERARNIARIVRDAERHISIEMGAMKGPSAKAV
jgi:hypothetical protein